MPTYQRFGSNNQENRKDRRKPAIELNEEPAVVVRETSPTVQLTPQDRHDETQEPDHSVSLGDSGASSTRIKFSVHTAQVPTRSRQDYLPEYNGYPNSYFLPG